MNINWVILGTIETEKALNKLQPAWKYVFIVNSNSTKVDIKNTVKKIYWVTVNSVNTIPVRKKIRSVWRWKIITKRDPFVKAVVTLKKWDNIDFWAFSWESAKVSKKVLKDNEKNNSKKETK